MTYQMVIDFPKSLFEILQAEARRTGDSPESWIVKHFHREFESNGHMKPSANMNEIDADAADARFMSHFGSFDSGDPNSADNDRIDADLAREYGATHDPE